MKYYNAESGMLLRFWKKSDSKFWDNLWDVENFKKQVEAGKKSRLVNGITKKFLPLGAKVLEGGCGKGQYVYGLRCHGYDSYGVDYAEKTVERLNQLFPELKIVTGDVQQLPFDDQFFDGYWSLGVIEHFYDGYELSAKEMHRVLKPNGFLFLTFPHLSWLRRYKIKKNKYDIFQEERAEMNDFYHFFLRSESVIDYFEKLGFELMYKKPFDGVKGLKDEVKFLNSTMNRLYGSKNFGVKVLKYYLSKILAPLTGHQILLVLRKKSSI
ncbi:MAG TPA: class I SAM-dependent methyltransferase [Candidatus Bipolaricaulota bacterium]|nr:class I SAM-dependent methyltransferase [Candidatus Bipolaricaulota bacterium]